MSNVKSLCLAGCLASIALPLALRAQPATPAVLHTVPQAVPGEFLVHFATRSYDLEALRRACHANRPAAETDAIVTELEEATVRERAEFVAAVERLGGQVVTNYWIINSSWIRIGAEHLAAVRQLPGVAAVQPNWVWYPVLLESTNASNHNSDAANLMRNAANELVRGTSKAVAIVDTGIDVSMGSSGRPHRCFYRGGNPTDQTGGGLNGSRILAMLNVGYGTDDNNGHGTMVSSCAAGHGWGSPSDNGFAPDAHLVGAKVSVDSSGGSNSAIIASAWQAVLSNKTRYNIVAGNCSYSGSPNPTEGAQQASDSAAWNGDILVCVPSGNNGSNIAATQAGFNAVNTGSNTKNTATRSSFSGYGTTALGKVIPDLCAIGQSVVMTLHNTETQVSAASGTSFSSPSAAGAGVLVRHARGTLSALEVKALMLNYVRPRTEGSGRGAGILQADLAVAAALRGDVVRSKLNASKRSEAFYFQAQQSAYQAVTVTWMRKAFSAASNDDLSLRVYDPGNNLVAQSVTGAANSYERVGFTAAQTGTYRAVVEAASLVNAEIDFAIAGGGQPTQPQKPVLTAINPNQVPIVNGPTVTLTGTGLDTVDTVWVGTVKVTPKSASATTVTFAPPPAPALGPVAVSVQNPAGQSNALSLTYVGAHPPVLIGPTQVLTNQLQSDELFCDDGWIGLDWVSASNVPSRINGIIDLGIGNNFAELFLFHVFVCDKAGRSLLQWMVPPGFASQVFHFQVAVVDPKGVRYPLETSGILTKRVLF